MKYTYYLSIFAFIFILGSCQESGIFYKAFFENQVVLKSNERVAAYAIPNIVSTAKGTILCFVTARIGDNHDWGNVQEVAMILSTDNGETWEDPQIIAAIDNWTVRQTSAIVIPETNKILVFGHKSQRFNSEGERISERWRIAHPEERKRLGDANFFIESTDEGKTWSEMKDIDLPYWPHDPGISLKYGNHKGRLILPARTIKGIKFDWNNLYNGVLVSDDHGQTWRAGGLTQSYVGEACVVELSDGRVYVNSRNHNDNFGIRVHAISSDGGETFTEYGNDPQLIEPTCDAGMVRLNDPDDGNVILFSNPAVNASKRWDGPSRRRMSVKASFDDCKTWPLLKLVFAGPAAYSGLAVGLEGMIFLVYERARLNSDNSRENIAIARFNLAWLKQKEIEPPKISPKEQVFFDRQEVTITSDPDYKIHYTLDGSDPDENSNLYSEPFEITESTFVKAVSISEENSRSILTPSQFIRSLYQAPKYLNPFNPKYPASGPFALVDGLYGSINFNDGHWQGFEQDDFEVVLDLASERVVENIQINFLQSTEFWIFFPKWVSFSISTDGQTFKKVKTIKNKISPKEIENSIQSFTVQASKQKTRYVKVKAKNLVLCPPWHKGVGGKAWLFADEITISYAK